MRALVLILALGALASPALAGTPVNLRADAADADGVVTLGDLFDNAGAAANVTVARRAGPTAVLDAAAVQMAAQRAGLDWSNPQGLRRIIVSAGASGGASAGPARGNVEVLTYARNLSAGDIVQAQDLVWGKAVAAPADAPSDPDRIIGMTARRPLREGAAVSQRDVSAPMAMKAGDVVAVTFEQDGIVLTLQGKAMAAAAVGDGVAVQNTSSSKIIQAVATGPGTAAVGPEALRLKAAPQRYAQR